MWRLKNKICGISTYTFEGTSMLSADCDNNCDFSKIEDKIKEVENQAPIFHIVHCSKFNA